MGAWGDRGRRLRRAAALAVAVVALAGCIDRRLAREFTRVDESLLTSPAMHVMLCGTGTGLADPERAGTCVAILAGGLFVLFDVGPGAWEVVDLANLPLAHLDGVFVTKFLADDIGDLGEAITRSWIAGREAPLAIYGPTGTGRLVSALDEISALDAATRLARHDAAVLRPSGARAEPHEFALDDAGAGLVFDRQGVRVIAFSVGRPDEPPSLGYRIDYRGRSVVIAGHARNHPNVVRWAAGADILIHEAASDPMLERGMHVMERVGQPRLATFTREMLKNHATAVEAATAARDARVDLLVLTHLVPPPQNWFYRRYFLRGVRAVFPHVVVGEEGMRFRLDPR